MTRKLLKIMYCETTAIVHAERKYRNVGIVPIENRCFRKGNVQIRQTKSYLKILVEAGSYMDTGK